MSKFNRKVLGEMEMKHFTKEEWIDFVNQVASIDQQKAMQKHLATGCKPCTQTLALWQKLRKTAAAEASYQPPLGSVRLVKAAFATAGFATAQKKPGVIEMLFDSFLQPSVAGARSTGSGTRQMLYRADPFQIDIQIEAKSGSNRLVVTGQLLDMSSPEVPGDSVQIILSNRRGSVVQATTNQFGEFSGEVENSGDLQLSFGTHGEKPTVISLRDALGKLPGARGGARG
jgi:hypothetical protein